MIRIKNLLQGEYVFSRRDRHSGERWHVILKHFIEGMFDENVCRIYKF